MKTVKGCTSVAVGCLALVMMVVLQAEAAVVKYDWTVDYMFAAPDCVEKQILAVNGQYPSPTIRAVEGDTVVVRVTNRIPSEGVVFHWHGMHQRGTPFYDGAAYVSQCPINPGETFTYSFKVDRAGTYFYHGHFGMQRSGGLYGSLIVDLPANKKELFSYDGEHSIVPNDWWHKSMAIVEDPPTHQSHRRKLNPYFYPDALKTMVDGMVEGAASGIQRLDEKVSQGGGCRHRCTSRFVLPSPAVYSMALVSDAAGFITVHHPWLLEGILVGVDHCLPVSFSPRW